MSNQTSKNIFRARRRQLGGGRRRRRTANPFIIYAVLGALAFGVVPVESLHAVGRVQRRESGENAVARPPKIENAPLRAFLVRAKRQKDAGKLDLSATRTITIDADRAEDGTLTNAVITGPSAGNPNFKRLAQDFVASLNESRALRFLSDVSHVRMTFTLDGQRFTAQTASDAPSAERAAEMARGYRAMINVARLMRRGTDEAVVLSNMKISSSGKQLLMNLDMPREQMGNILLKQITPN
jgi:hypothetical protein